MNLWNFLRSTERWRLKMYPCQKLASWCKSPARYYHNYALVTPYKSFKNGLVLHVRNQPNLARIWMAHNNRGNISSLTGGETLHFGMEAFYILFFLPITTELVISQIKFLWRHHFDTLLDPDANVVWATSDKEPL